MGTAQLQGKRTGRPPGIKSRPWRRAVLWCIRNLDKADAVPPSPLAGRLLALGREHPDRLVSLVIQLDGQGDGRMGNDSPKPRAPAVPTQVPSEKGTLEITLTVPPSPSRECVNLRASDLLRWLQGGKHFQPQGFDRLPKSIRIVGCRLETSGNEPILILGWE